MQHIIDENFVRNFPMAKLWPTAPSRLATSYDEKIPKLDVPLPSPAEQDSLIDLYFAYVNPIFPVIDKDTFMAQYHMQ